MCLDLIYSKTGHRLCPGFRPEVLEPFGPLRRQGERQKVDPIGQL